MFFLNFLNLYMSLFIGSLWEAQTENSVKGKFEKTKNKNSI